MLPDCDSVNHALLPECVKVYMYVGRVEPRPVAPATRCSGWEELHTSEWVEPLLVVVSARIL